MKIVIVLTSHNLLGKARARWGVLAQVAVYSDEDGTLLNAQSCVRSRGV